MICIANGGGQDRLHELEVSTEQWEQFEKLTMSGTVSEGGIVHCALWRGVSATTLTMMLPLSPLLCVSAMQGAGVEKDPPQAVNARINALLDMKLLVHNRHFERCFTVYFCARNHGAKLTGACLVTCVLLRAGVCGSSS